MRVDDDTARVLGHQEQHAEGPIGGDDGRPWRFVRDNRQQRADPTAEIKNRGCVSQCETRDELTVGRQQHVAPTAPSERVTGGVDPHLEAIIMKALAKNRDERYLNAADMLNALAAWRTSNTPEMRASKTSIEVTARFQRGCISLMPRRVWL